MSDELASKECIPCKGNTPALKGDALRRLADQLPGWDVVDEHHLSKIFSFKNFVEGLAFVNRLGELAEQQGHHPDIYLAWGIVRVEVWTHAIDGLTESDFVWAAKADRISLH